MPAGGEPAVCVVGAALVDLIAYVPRLPRVGETLHGTDFRTGNGGKGANQAVMAARLGARVTMVTRVGRDAFGAGMLENFRAQGIDTAHVLVIDDAPSGVAPIAVDPNGDNAIIIVTGANDRLTPDDVDRARPAIAAADVVVCQLEIPFEVSEAALRVAREEGTQTILNPAPAVADLAAEVYGLADVFCPNEPETELLLGRPLEAGAESDAAAEFVARGAGSVVLTLGERGCLVYADGDPTLLPADVVAAVDTTGAGDAFVGSLAYFVARGETLVEAAARANRIAAISVQAPGTQTSFPSAADLPEDLYAVSSLASRPKSDGPSSAS
jgi:ribokinase